MMRIVLAAVLAWLAVAAPAQAQFSDQMTWGGTSTGTAGNYTLSIPNIATVNDIVGVEIRWTPNVSNTGATQLTISSSGTVGPYIIQKNSSAGLIHVAANDLLAGVPVSILHNGTNYILMSPQVVTPAPTEQILTSGTSYTTGVVNQQTARLIKIRMVGGGGGGGGTSTAGGTGGTTTFNSVTAIGGGGGGTTTTRTGGAGGTGGSGTASRRVTGNAGMECFGSGATAGLPGCGGGAGPWGGSGKGATSGNSAGSAGATNSGSGGGGASTQSGNTSAGGGGGGSGEYVEIVISSPAASYTYAIGAGGTAGTGTAGGAGGSGVIIVEEFYLRCMRLENELMPANDNDEEQRCAA
jgi:hypothetical protein